MQVNDVPVEAIDYAVKYESQWNLVSTLKGHLLEEVRVAGGHLIVYFVERHACDVMLPIADPQLQTLESAWMLLRFHCDCRLHQEEPPLLFYGVCVNWSCDRYSLCKRGTMKKHKRSWH